MEDVLALKSRELFAEEATAEEATAEALLGATAEELLGETARDAVNVEAGEGAATAAAVAASSTAVQTDLLAMTPPPPPLPPGCCYRSDMVAASTAYLPPNTNPSTLAANGTTVATTPGEVEEGVLQGSCGSPVEGVSNSDMNSVEESSRRSRETDCYLENFPPPPPPGMASSNANANAAQHTPDQKSGIVADGDGIGDQNDGIGDQNDGARRTRTVPELPEPVLNFTPPQSASWPQQPSSVLVRPNAPMVLIIYRSDVPPPDGFRRSLESAATTVAGGARIDFMEISATIAADSTSDYRYFGGEEEELASRRKVLEARLSRLLVGAESGANRGK